MKFLLGTKEEMTQIYDSAGLAQPVTVVSFGDLVVTQTKTKEKDGYSAVQVGFGDKKAKNINKPLRGHIKDLGNFKYLKEFRTIEDPTLSVGDKVKNEFLEGSSITVSAVSKGKGFQGGVKRHGFHGGRRSHGQKHSEREPGSIGAGGMQKVLKGTRMAGRMGGDRITVKNLKIVHIDNDTNKIYIKGAVPGRRGTLVEIFG
ncbi:50S ribosomal protein L3 [Candidatus Campbellbacteria bacterium CG22_combo_CG10-13_8_21_14_all_36_13]|uniref:50S ribosomal protein L3 n=1 Tax=Candidatus Campbellbacteria bacterium CG22_combo_CG10-13_8_21_14_all_36_13 TaxID=1974529 RepID=A0A2H0DY74_9BACT|nr:MAG: 50S ribosomal protein L3 [Candidatus Campbellbacteria bacterium CG22_combo_CG10-13_8_21_14_all_36_13]